MTTHVPDLLHATPIVRVDLAATKLAIALAFASGMAGGLFGEALEKATVAPSRWDPALYANDLFLAPFVSLSFKVVIDGKDYVLASKHLVNVLAQPPEEEATIHHRREILSELVARPELRESLEKLYVTLCRFRTLIEGSTTGRTWDLNRRQLDILAVVKDVIDTMATGFATARSGLSRLASFAQRVQASEPYRSLSDLLRYDEKHAALSLKVWMGADRRIRSFEIVSLETDETNQFSRSNWSRLLAKLELFVRGYGFSDGEIMARLIDAVFSGLEDEITRFVQLLGDVELYLGALGFRDRAHEAGLEVCLPKLVSPEQPRALYRLFNPLLLAHGVVPVPCDLVTDRHDVTVLVTGPNSGGKTRLLQCIGLSQVLAQSGMFVPAREGTVVLARRLVVSLVEQTRADQGEGRLGMELVRIRQLFERLPPGAMVILDELCSGTNPSEGEEIFELVVRMLSRLKPYAFITTHFLTFAARLEREKKIPELRFLQVALGERHEPTYQFTAGVAATSLAGQAAKRLGVSGDELLTLIERNIERERLPAR